MSRLMMKYGPALLEKMEREKLDALIRAEIEPAEDNCRFSKRLIAYQLKYEELTKKGKKEKK